MGTKSFTMMLVGAAALWVAYAFGAQYVHASSYEGHADEVEDASFAFIQMMRHQGYDDIRITPQEDPTCAPTAVLQATFTATKPGHSMVRGRLCIGGNTGI